MNLFNLQFYKDKNRALKNIYQRLNDDRCTVSWRKANFYIKSIKKATNIGDVKNFIIEELNQILRMARRNVEIFDEKTKRFKFSDVQVSVDHSYLDNTQKDLIEQELIVLRSIAKTFDLSR